MKMKVKVILIVMMCILPLGVYGQAITIPEASEPTTGDGSDSKEIVKADATSDGLAGDFNFGVGIGVNMLDDEHVIDASVVNDEIHISNAESNRVQLWLEGHYLFGSDFTKWECANGCLVLNLDGEVEEIPSKGHYYRHRRFYHGPFFAVQVSDGDSLINGAALGYMMSFKKTDLSDSKSDRYFNVGLGVSTSKVRTLGNQKEGDAVGANEQISFKTESVTGILLLFSVNVF